MYFSMIRLHKNVSPREVVELSNINGYHTHKLVWNLFADHPDRTRDFLYRYESVNGWPTFYTVSAREPVNNGELWEIHTKEYKPQLATGQRLGFSLRANPIRSRRDETGRQHRHDVVMEEKLKMKAEGKKIELSDIVQEQGLKWLQERAEPHGFSIMPNSVRGDGYQQHKLFKGKGNKPVTFSTLEYTGSLSVVEPDLFIEKCLFDGIGPAKGFGCGLMLVRRV